jgi:hypothetical protein
MQLDEFLKRFNELSSEAKTATLDDANAILGNPVWVANVGPQHEAYHCQADELFYGGQAGGGKSDLLLGLALTAHFDSLILRRFNRDIKSLVKRATEIAGSRNGFNRNDMIFTRPDSRTIEFGGCQFEDDKERYKGRPHDLKAFDEVSDFTESQYNFIIGWNRTTKKGQRCRVVATGNPPTRPEGLWVLKRWGAWLDPKHPRPAEPGELRWYTTDDRGNEIEVDGTGPHLIDGKPIYARSRTFMPARVTDNPDLLASGYQAMLDALPAELRAAYRDGNFQAEWHDDEFQVIPTAWIRAAMNRWSADGWRDNLMTAMAVDPAGGGADAAEIAWRHGSWYAPVVTVRGAETADGSAMAAHVIRHRRGPCPVIIDAGGGYGGAITQRLLDNGVPATSFNGASESRVLTQDASKLAFCNKRAEAWWRFREALNPDQEGGSNIALPHDEELKADLASIHWELTARGIKLEAKEDIRKQIGRSPSKGDAVTMAWSEGQKAAKRALRHSRSVEVQGVGGYDPHTGQYRTC